MGDVKSINKTGRATPYLAVGTAENSCKSRVLKERNITRRLFLIPCWHWVYGGPLLYTVAVVCKKVGICHWTYLLILRDVSFLCLVLFD